MAQNKKLFFLFTFLIFLLFVTCVTNLGVLDETVPQAELSHIHLWDDIRVVVFNDQPVDWRASGFANRATISIPSGRHSLMVAWTVEREIEPVPSYGPSTEHINLTNIFYQEFRPGHIYRISQRIGILGFLFPRWVLPHVEIRDVTRSR
jgi:hypothetical protein